MVGIALMDPIVPTLPPVKQQRNTFFNFLSAGGSNKASLFDRNPYFLRRNICIVVASLELQLARLATINEQPTRRTSRLRNARPVLIFGFAPKRKPLQVGLDEIVRKIWQSKQVIIESAESLDLASCLRKQYEVDRLTQTPRISRKPTMGRRTRRKHIPAKRLV